MNRSFGIHGIFSAIAALVVLIGHAGAEEPRTPARRSLNVYVTNFGINQWNPGMTRGQDFSSGVSNHVVPDVSPSGQFLIPMPRDEELPRTASEHREFVEGLATDIETGIASRAEAASGRFELQIVQNVGTGGYFEDVALPWGRQRAAIDFETDVYTALGMAKRGLERSFDVIMPGIDGSNAASTATTVIPRLRDNPLDSLTIVNGRAFVDDTIATYWAMRGNLSIVNSRGDFPSFGDMVANHDAACRVQEQCPGTRVYLVDSGDRNPWQAHLSAMNPQQEFHSVQEWQEGRASEVAASNGWDVITRAAAPRPGGVAATGSGDVGGVDFSDLHLSYAGRPADTRASAPLLVFSARCLGRGTGGTPPAQATAPSSRAFLVGLALPSSKFWVNLNPSEPERTVDPLLARTDVGRILLEADYQMKKDVAAITDPRTSPIGRTYWKRLTEAADGSAQQGTIWASERYWIVPGRILLSGDSDGVLLVDADLEVRVESTYLAARGIRNETPGAQERYDRIAEELILPLLTEVVNRAPQYAELRQVYHSLILATWYKDASRDGAIPCPRGIDSEDIAGLQSEIRWDPREVWQRYKTSADKGEYDFTEKESEKQGNVQVTTTRRYISGGVDFTQFELPRPEPFDLRVRSLLEEVLRTPSGARVGRVLWFVAAGTAIPRPQGVSPVSGPSAQGHGTAPAGGPWRVVAVMASLVCGAGLFLVLVRKRFLKCVSYAIAIACVALSVGVTGAAFLGLATAEESLSFLGLSYGGIVRRFWLHQFLTAPLLHTRLAHLLFNMVSLCTVGTTVERQLGARRFLVLVALCAASSSMGFLLLDDGANRVEVGSSGMVFGIIVAFGLLFPANRVALFALLPLKTIHAVLLMGAITLYLTISPEGAGLVQAADLFGAAAALAYLKGIRPLRPGPPNGPERQKPQTPERCRQKINKDIPKEL